MTKCSFGAVLYIGQIYIDYGLNWEHAWEAHVKAWETNPEAAHRQKGELDWNQQEQLSVTVSNLRDDEVGVVDDYYFPVCLFGNNGDEILGMDPLDEEEEELETVEWKHLTDDEILENFSYEGSPIQLPETVEDRGSPFGVYWPCSIVDVNEERNSYTVRIHQSQFHETTRWHATGEPVFLYDYPRSSIRFFVQPYRGDQHMREAFRHIIEIPDSIFPSHWKNRQSISE